MSGELTAIETQPKSVPVPDDLRIWFRKYARGFKFKKRLQEDSRIDQRICDKIIEGREVSPETVQKLQALKTEKEKL
jgi:hypothetical protein